jgi:RNA polymerase sigma factor (TIGR02999 family)
MPRATRAAKRNASRVCVTFDEGRFKGFRANVSFDVLALNQALTRLAAIDARKARVVELRFFGGLSVEETARVAGVSVETVARDWRAAKLWLRRELGRTVAS